MKKKKKLIQPPPQHSDAEDDDEPDAIRVDRQDCDNRGPHERRFYDAAGQLVLHLPLAPGEKIPPYLHNLLNLPPVEGK